MPSSPGFFSKEEKGTVLSFWQACLEKRQKAAQIFSETEEKLAERERPRLILFPVLFADQTVTSAKKVPRQRAVNMQF